MAYYLITKRGLRMTVHLAVGRGAYVQTSCGLYIGKQTNEYKQATTKKLGGIWNEDYLKLVTCTNCIAYGPQPVWARIPDEERQPKGHGQRRQPLFNRDGTPRKNSKLRGWKGSGRD